MDNIIPIAVGVIVYLLIYMLGSVLVLLWGVVAPLFGKYQQPISCISLKLIIPISTKIIEMEMPRHCLFVY